MSFLKPSRFQQAAEMYGLIVVGVLLVLAGARCVGERTGRRDAELAQLAENAHKASLSAAHSRRTTDSAMLAIRRVDTVVVERVRTVRSAVDTARAIVDTASLVTLRVTVRTLADRAEALADIVEVQRDSLATLFDAHAKERAANAELIVAKDAEIAALREVARCRVLFVPCPSRTTAFLGGAGLALLAVVVL